MKAALVRLIAFATVVVLASSGAALGARKGKATKAASPIGEAKRAPPVLPAEKLAKVREILLGDDDAAAADAAKALGQSGASNAIEPLVDLLSVGTTPTRAEAAIEALGALADARSVDVLERLRRESRGRCAAARRQGPGRDQGRAHDAPVLIDALGDAAPDVRAAAADALAARKDTEGRPAAARARQAQRRGRGPGARAARDTRSRARPGRAAREPSTTTCSRRRSASTSSVRTCPIRCASTSSTRSAASRAPRRRRRSSNT